MLSGVLVSYKEYYDTCYLFKEWRDEDNCLHREDGPAFVGHDADGSIYVEHFYIDGEFLGAYEKGFWALWEKLTEVERQAPALLKCLARYS